MIDLKKLRKFKSVIEKVNLEICEHSQKDLNSSCARGNCPYGRLCEILTAAKFEASIMEHNPDNPYQDS